MEIFYSEAVEGNLVTLGDDEAVHCTRVLRHKAGDAINVIDGHGTLYRCRLLDDNPKHAVASIEDTVPDWGGHPYDLTMAVCPTKNPDRFEWFAEKACEMGLDTIVPVIGDHSERRVFKEARLRKILVSAAKQSLKGAVPEVGTPESVRDFIIRLKGETEMLKLIAYCFEDENHPRESLKSALADFKGDRIAVLIGPEGDFSPEEAALAIECGFKPVHLGDSRLRTETAALAAVAGVYFNYM